MKTLVDDINNFDTEQKIPSNGDVNEHRRKLLKGIGLSGTLMAMPALSSAAMINTDEALDTASGETSAEFELMDKAIGIEFSNVNERYSDPKLVRVSITNLGSKSVELRNLFPGTVSIDNREYDLNARLANNPITVQQGAVYHAWLCPCSGPSNGVALPETETAQRRMIPVTISRSGDANAITRQTQRAHAVIV